MALISASLPIVRLGVVMMMSPGLPALLVSTVSLLLSVRRTAWGALTVIVPPSPLASVKAESDAPWSMVSWGGIDVNFTSITCTFSLGKEPTIRA